LAQGHSPELYRFINELYGGPACEAVRDEMLKGVEACQSQQVECCQLGKHRLPVAQVIQTLGSTDGWIVSKSWL
jgi:hypothetical protein